MHYLSDRYELERAREIIGETGLLGRTTKAPGWFEDLLANTPFFGALQQRMSSFERDYPALLLSLSSGVRTGLDPFSALCKARNLFSDDSEIRRQLTRLSESIEQGLSEDEAIRRFGQDIPHPDLKLFRTAFILARKEGASLAESLQRLARVTRQRQSFRRKIRAAVAMQKLSAIGIALCTLVIAVIQAGTNPEALHIAWQNPAGARILAVGLALVVGGLGWMFFMTKSKW